MYAIVKTGGKQYRVTAGQWLRVERLRAREGEAVALPALLVVDGDQVIDGEAAGEIAVTARVLAHERGPKLRVVKFKPKRGYRRRNGHRQELTRIQIESIGPGAPRLDPAAAPRAAAPVGAGVKEAGSGS